MYTRGWYVSVFDTEVLAVLLYRRRNARDSSFAQLKRVRILYVLEDRRACADGVLLHCLLLPYMPPLILQRYVTRYVGKNCTRYETFWLDSILQTFIIFRYILVLTRVNKTSVKKCFELFEASDSHSRVQIP